jgi:hypothetical protein
VSPDNAEALFKEARQRRRHRQAWIAVGIVLVLTIAGLALAVVRSGPPTAPARRVGGPRTLPATPSPGDRGVSSASGYTPVQEMGLADDAVGWAADGLGIYLTTDQGRTWRTITPPNLANEDVSERIGALDAIGQNDLWLALEDVPGLVPYAQSTDGSDRGGGIDRSSDGGLTWTFTTLPGCLQSCGPNLSLSFGDPRHGFAAIGPGEAGSVMLFSTDNGDETWTGLGAQPDLGGSAQVVFSSPLDGWAVTGPVFFGNSGEANERGGMFYRTTDGGVSWSPAPAPAPGLPAEDQFAVPTFFGTRTGVMLSNPENVPGSRPLCWSPMTAGRHGPLTRCLPLPGLLDISRGASDCALPPLNLPVG